jgi:hypothetical protein
MVTLGKYITMDRHNIDFTDIHKQTVF